MGITLRLRQFRDEISSDGTYDRNEVHVVWCRSAGRGETVKERRNEGGKTDIRRGPSKMSQLSDRLGGVGGGRPPLMLLYGLVVLPID
jgi:hypothetical protein